MIVQDSLQELQALIDKYVLGPARITKPLNQSRGLRIERAVKENAPEVARWAESGDARFIGAKGVRLNSSEVVSWINESVGAYVLVSPSDELLAFGNIAPYEGDDLSTIEIGRLLVAPEKRRQGFGSTLVWNLCLAIGEAYKAQNLALPIQPSLTLSRVVPDNQIGLQFIQTLPFTELETGPDAYHKWYEYFINRPKTELLGIKMKQLREQLGLSQAQLAVMCGVQRESINMVESGSRTASLDLLWSICRALGHDQFDRVELLLAAIGEEPESSLRNYPTVSNASPETRQNLWVATDTLAESQMDIYYENTKQAIMQGYDRVFFMPDARWRSQGEKLKARLEEELGSEYRANIEKHFKFYEAPEWLCYFRIVVENPTDQVARKITVGGENYIRLPLSEAQAEIIFSVLNNGMIEADVAASKNKPEAVGGFRKRFPLPKGKKK